ELGLENLNGEVSQVKIENEYKREEKRIERAIKEEEKERKRKGYERIMDSNQDGGTKDDSVVRCPKCGSISITANKKGFSLAKGALGVATVGAYGVLAAGHGKNKVLVTCLKCGHQWKPGK
ncbi:MAG: hypothetical protein RSB70_06510, partial [Clostridium sp.]